MKDSILLFLVLFPLVGAFVSYLIGRKNKILRDHFVALVCIIDFAVMFVLFFKVASGETFNYYLKDIFAQTLHFQLDGFRIIFGTVCAFMWAMTALFSHEYFSYSKNRNRYFFFLLLAFVGTVGVFLSGNLYTTFVFFELMSIASYVLVVHNESTEAMRVGYIYIFTVLFSGVVIFIGLFLLQKAVGTLEIDNLNAAVVDYYANGGDGKLIWASSLCLLFGFGAKAGMFPLHTWLPKTHSVAPAPASALFSGILTKTGVFGILILSSRIFFYNVVWGEIMLYIGVITMFLGALLALFSIDLKRTLAYSSMSQIGFILVGVGMQGLLGSYNALAVRGTLLHMINHSILKLVLFMCAGVVYMNSKKLNLNDVRGFGKGKPLLNFIFLMGVFGIIGMPLWNGYVSKTLLHESILEYIEILHDGGLATNTYKVIKWAFLISGGFTVAYMIKMYICIFFENNVDNKIQKKFDKLNGKYMSSESSFALLTSALLLPFLGFSGWSKFPIQGMNFLASLGQGFMHGEEPTYAVNYLSIGNLKGGFISLVIGAAVYLLIVRIFLMKRINGKKVYVDRWQKLLNL